MTEDKPRLLARQSELGYTSSGFQALTGAGEAVSEDAQREISHKASASAQDQRHAQLEQIRQRLAREIDYLAAQLRHKQRELRRIDQRLSSS